MKYEKKQLGDLGRIVTGKTPTTRNTEFWDGSIPFVTPKDIQGLKQIKATERYLTIDGLTTVKGSILPPNAVCVSCIGNIGYVGMTTEKCVSNQQINSIVVNNDNDADFVYYLIKSLWNYFKNYEGQSTTLSILNKTQFSKIEVDVPCISDQRRIAAVLKSLDNKIAINQQINDNLQQQVAAIYKAWYQEFSLVDTEDFVKTEYGMIPRGWHYTLLGNLCQSISVTHKFDKKELIFLNTGDIEDGRFLHSNYMPVKEMPGQAKKAIAQGDILYSEIRPINRHFAFVNFPASDYVVSTKLMVIRATSVDAVRLYHYLTSDSVLAELQLQAESRSGTFPQIRFDNVSRLPILIADERTERRFIELLHAVYAQIEHINKENKMLSDLRDSLLPKLMSGGIDVSDILI